MDKVNKLTVRFNGRLVGTMALHERYLCAFEYDSDWLADGFSISPLSLPLEKKVYIPSIDPFNGVFGVFDDCMPDGWGRLLVDRFLLKNKIDPNSINMLDRLSIVGGSGMGALTFEPDKHFDIAVSDFDLDKLSIQCQKILNSEHSDDLDELFIRGGSSGGARPKIMTEIDNEQWIIKFPTSEDGVNIGKMEYDYAACAKLCRIEMEEVRLFPSKITSGYFGTKRFDRKSGKRIHMISAGGLLETSHRIPNLDYVTLMRLTLELTKDYDEVFKLFKLMCFNVFAHNRDDHAKNFTYLYDDINSKWTLSPAYDLTLSYSLGGEHATTVNGNGADPNLNDLLAIAGSIGLNKEKATKAAKAIRECVNDNLSSYLTKPRL